MLNHNNVQKQENEHNRQSGQRQDRWQAAFFYGGKHGRI